LAQIQAHGLHSFVQSRALVRMSRGAHPICAKLDALQLLHARRDEIGERLARGHPRRGSRRPERQGRALERDHRLACEIVVKAIRVAGDPDVRAGDLPRSDHLTACDETCHRSIANRDPERFGTHKGQTEHALGGLAQDCR